MTTDNLVAVTNTVAVCVEYVNATFSIADLTVSVSVDTIASIRSRSIVVASRHVLAARNLIAVTNAIAVHVEDIDSAFTVANLAVAVSVDAAAVIFGCALGEVASLSIGTSRWDEEATSVFEVSIRIVVGSTFFGTTANAVEERDVHPLVVHVVSVREDLSRE